MPGRPLVTVRTIDDTQAVIDMIVTWIYRKAWDGRLLGDQLDEIGFDSLKKSVLEKILPENIVSGPEIS